MPNKARIYPPDRHLRERIGEDLQLDKVFTQHRIERAQQHITEVQEKFLHNSEEKIYAIVLNGRKSPTSEQTKHLFLENSVVLRGMAESLGFKLLAHTLASLKNYSEDHLPEDPHAAVIIAKHVNLLELIMEEQIAGDGGDLGRELLDALAMLVNHFHPSDNDESP